MLQIISEKLADMIRMVRPFSSGGRSLIGRWNISVGSGILADDLSEKYFSIFLNSLLTKRKIRI
ncbi:MAG TPA: hypothetical protein DE060_04780 [Lentisphaeria bacterium]|nr:hypothetical protein [Lentisphaeria bacterium]HCG48509.1 hypothetical protein [Lentisphaeria bacterium]